MSNNIRRLLMLSAVLMVGACHEPYPLVYYPAPAPVPLQPYAGPVVAVPAPVVKRSVKRHYRKRHYRPRCRCNPTG